MKFPQKQKGQGLVEYALLLVLVAVVVLAILMLLGPQINAVFQKVMIGLTGEDPANPNYTYSISNFGVTGTSGAFGCEVELSNAMQVTVTHNGSAVNNEAVLVKVTLTGGDTTTLTGVTNASGKASWSAGDSVGSASGACGGGRTATATIGGATASDTF